MYEVGTIFEPIQDPTQTYKIIGRYNTPSELTAMVIWADHIQFGDIQTFIRTASYPCYLVKEISVAQKEPGMIIVQQTHPHFDDWEQVL